MKMIRSVLLKGFGNATQGAKRLAVFIAATGLLLTVSVPSAKAESVTQLEALKWLVQLSGESSRFSVNSTAADFVQWARIRGMNPSGGWQPNTALTSDSLAQILVQYFKIAPSKKASDYSLILRREGIVLPNGGTISRADLVRIFGRHFHVINRPNHGDDDDDDDDSGKGGDDDGGGSSDDDGDDDGGRDDDDGGKGSPSKPPHGKKPPKNPKPPKPPKNKHDRDDD